MTVIKMALLNKRASITKIKMNDPNMHGTVEKSRTRSDSTKFVIRWKFKTICFF